MSCPYHNDFVGRVVGCPWCEIPMCQNWPDAPGCQGRADLEYTMRFDDIGEPPIYWCEPCGKFAREIDDQFQRAFAERGDDFADELRAAIDDAEGTKH